MTHHLKVTFYIKYHHHNSYIQITSCYYQEKIDNVLSTKHYNTDRQWKLVVNGNRESESEEKPSRKQKMRKHYRCDNFHIFFGKWENKIIVLYVLYVLYWCTTSKRSSELENMSIVYVILYALWIEKERIKGNLKSILMGRFASLYHEYKIPNRKLVCLGFSFIVFELRKFYFPKVVHTIE